MTEQVLSGKVAIITGASQGFGFAVARAYTLAGAHLMLCARNEKQLKQAEYALIKLATPQQIIQTRCIDVSVPEDVSFLVNETMNIFNDCHILVNNAGIYGPKGSIDTVDWSEWTKTIEINVYGPVLMCRAFVPHFKAKGAGNIIMLSGGGGYSAYALCQCLCDVKSCNCPLYRNLS